MPDKLKEALALKIQALLHEHLVVEGIVIPGSQIEVFDITNLSTQLRVKDETDGVPRYFNVKVSESIW